MVQDSRRFRIPVRSTGSVKHDERQTTENASLDGDDIAQPPAPQAPGTIDRASIGMREAGAAESREPVRDYVREAIQDADGGAVDWRSVAVRLQEDAQSYRQRQALRDAQRLMEERERLLLPFLEVLDNLERTLAVAREDEASSATPLYQGVSVAYRGMRNLLEREGVAVIETVGLPFDPQLHEAVAMIPGKPGQRLENEVVEEIRRGYRQGERILRPARVVVAQSPG